MSEFEYLAVFSSIIFGLSLTHILSGVISAIYCKEIDQTHMVLTVFFLLVMILNWWTGYQWRGEVAWSFDKFLVIVIWSVSHYVAAITLYPPQSVRLDDIARYRCNWFLGAFMCVAGLDAVQAFIKGSLFEPWFLLPFILHYMLISLVAILINRPAVHRWIAWYLLVSITLWSLVVRRLIV